MKRLKEAYSIKRELITRDITELGNILKENSNIETININPDNTLYVESNCGMDSIMNNLECSVKKLINMSINTPYNMIYNTLPISNNSCIIRI